MYNEPRTSQTKPSDPPQGGRLITIEGIDGSGKSTQVTRLQERLNRDGICVRVLREPGGTHIGEAIRQILLDRANSRLCVETELLLFAAARAQLVREVIAPALEAGIWVLCDRFADSTVAYQGHGRQLDLDLITRLNQLAVGAFQPHRTIWLDLPVDQALQRLANRQQKQDRLDQENRAFMERTQEGYRQLAAAEPGRIVRMDARLTQDQLAEQIYRAVREGPST